MTEIVTLRESLGDVLLAKDLDKIDGNSTVTWFDEKFTAGEIGKRFGMSINAGENHIEFTEWEGFGELDLVGLTDVLLGRRAEPPAGVGRFGLAVALLAKVVSTRFDQQALVAVVEVHVSILTIENNTIARDLQSHTVTVTSAVDLVLRASQRLTSLVFVSEMLLPLAGKIHTKRLLCAALLFQN